MILDVYLGFASELIIQDKNRLLGDICDVFNRHWYYPFELIPYPICNFVDYKITTNFCSEPCLICIIKQIYSKINLNYILVTQNEENIRDVILFLTIAYATCFFFIVIKIIYVNLQLIVEHML